MLRIYCSHYFVLHTICRIDRDSVVRDRNPACISVGTVPSRGRGGAAGTTRSSNTSSYQDALLSFSAPLCFLLLKAAIPIIQELRLQAALNLNHHKPRRKCYSSILTSLVIISPFAGEIADDPDLGGMPISAVISVAMRTRYYNCPSLWHNRVASWII